MVMAWDHDDDSVLVEDCSPLIQYAPEDAWRDAPFNDTMATVCEHVARPYVNSCQTQLYSGGSYHLSSTKGATATFKFRGRFCLLFILQLPMISVHHRCRIYNLWR